MPPLPHPTGAEQRGDGSRSAARGTWSQSSVGAGAGAASASAAARQALRVVVDFTSGINLYPDLRFCNDSAPYLWLTSIFLLQGHRLLSKFIQVIFIVA